MPLADTLLADLDMDEGAQEDDVDVKPSLQDSDNKDVNMEFFPLLSKQCLLSMMCQN